LQSLSSLKEGYAVVHDYQLRRGEISTVANSFNLSRRTELLAALHSKLLTCRERIIGKEASIIVFLLLLTSKVNEFEIERRQTRPTKNELRGP
jgi:hypothetical protein